MRTTLNEVIDYQPYIEKITAFYIEIQKKDTSSFRSILENSMLKVKGLNPINNRSKETNRIYIDTKMSELEIKSLFPTNCPIIGSEELKIDFEQADYKEILRKILPLEITVPTSFESIGTIAFLNLREAQLDYRFTIGKVILDSHPTFKTVVNKSEKLNNIFRTPILDLIAGVKNYETEIKEEKTKLILNVEEVYFCTRLQSERSRVLNQIAPKEVIIDVFCGIGPFSIRAANENNCICYANDLNPECFKYLKVNIKKNKVEKKVFSFNMDGREFMRSIFHKISQKEIKRVDHIYMNLPAIGIEFLDVFNEEEFKKWDFEGIKIHTTCFEAFEKEDEETIAKVKKRIEKIMYKVFDCISFLKFHFIKNVSKTKSMICVSLLVKKNGKVLEESLEKRDSIDVKLDLNEKEIVGSKKIKEE